MRINKAENVWWNVAVHGWPGPLPVMTVLLRTRRCDDEMSATNNTTSFYSFGQVFACMVGCQRFKYWFLQKWRFLLAAVVSATFVRTRTGVLQLIQGEKYFWPRGAEKSRNAIICELANLIATPSVRPFKSPADQQTSNLCRLPFSTGISTIHSLLPKHQIIRNPVDPTEGKTYSLTFLS